MFDFVKCFALQKDLDNKIYLNHDIKEKNVEEKKYLALIIEVSEFINETKCFKYWSKKIVDQNKLVEEYIDCLHFFLSFGKKFNFTNIFLNKFLQENNVKIHEGEILEYLFCFLKCLTDNNCKNFDNETQYLNCFQMFWNLKNYFKIDETLIFETYIQKNTINHHRQKNNY